MSTCSDGRPLHPEPPDKASTSTGSDGRPLNPEPPDKDALPGRKSVLAPEPPSCLAAPPF
eukprot:351060-Chlamydomonas_euryale.AAC.1